MDTTEKKVLFVDDQKEILTVIERTLKDEPYQKAFAMSADEALQKLETERFDVVVSDILMPGKNGLQFLKEVKEKYPETVRIILSGYSQVSSILSALNGGYIHRFITKPWKVDSDAKQIIRDAVDFSESLKRQQNFPDPQKICFDRKKFFDFLSAMDCSITLKTEDEMVFSNEKDGMDESSKVFDLGETYQIHLR